METLQNGVIPIPDVDTMEVRRKFSRWTLCMMLDLHSEMSNLWYAAAKLWQI